MHVINLYSLQIIAYYIRTVINCRTVVLDIRVACRMADIAFMKAKTDYIRI